MKPSPLKEIDSADLHGPSLLRLGWGQKRRLEMRNQCYQCLKVLRQRWQEGSEGKGTGRQA